ncbi:MAG: T9SS type A sorting domain-containing protein [Bacteroidota bacterium]
MRFLYFLLLILVLSLKLQAATCTVTVSANWTSGSTWSCGSVPSCNDIIIIPSGYTVTINSSVDLTGGGCTGTKINIYGVLFFSGNASRLDVVATSSVNIYTGGKITTDQPGNNSQKINIGNGSSEWTSGNGNLSGPWTITNGSSTSNPTLPIQLIEFKGVCVSSGIHLDWSTASERINDHFLVEKSTNGVDWQFVAKIQGNGTTSTMHRYSYLDTKLNAELTYYRLSQVDLTGEKTIYKSIDMNCEANSNGQMLLYPNPASTQLNVLLMHNSPATAGYIKVYNMIGELVIELPVTLTKGSNSFVLPVELQSGTYNVEFSSENSILFNKKLIILN